jgi:hypothetical protein
VQTFGHVVSPSKLLTWPTLGSCRRRVVARRGERA